jgi:hypothetical protein
MSLNIGFMKGGKGTNLPDQDHVIRYVAWTRLRRDENDSVVGFLPQAFELRRGEPYLSVNWIEYQEGDHDTQIRLSVWAMRDSFEKPLGVKSAFAIANVAKLKQTSQNAGRRVRVVHEPEPGNPGHAAIRQLQSDDLNLLEALAADVFTEKINNADIPVKD